LIGLLIVVVVRVLVSSWFVSLVLWWVVSRLMMYSSLVGWGGLLCDGFVFVKLMSLLFVVVMRVMVVDGFVYRCVNVVLDCLGDSLVRKLVGMRVV